MPLIQNQKIKAWYQTILLKLQSRCNVALPIIPQCDLEHMNFPNRDSNSNFLSTSSLWPTSSDPAKTKFVSRTFLIDSNFINERIKSRGTRSTHVDAEAAGALHNGDGRGELAVVGGILRRKWEPVLLHRGARQPRCCPAKEVALLRKRGGVAEGNRAPSERRAGGQRQGPGGSRAHLTERQTWRRGGTESSCRRPPRRMRGGGSERWRSGMGVCVAGARRVEPGPALMRPRRYTYVLAHGTYIRNEIRRSDPVLLIWARPIELAVLATGPSLLCVQPGLLVF